MEKLKGFYLFIYFLPFISNFIALATFFTKTGALLKIPNISMFIVMFKGEVCHFISVCHQCVTSIPWWSQT